MRNTSLKLQLFQPRLVRKSDAAYYCSRSPARFETDCPVAPVVMGNGDRLWDVHDLDNWIDSLKLGQPIGDDDIVARLG